MIKRHLQKVFILNSIYRLHFLEIDAVFTESYLRYYERLVMATMYKATTSFSLVGHFLYWLSDNISFIAMFSNLWNCLHWFNAYIARPHYCA